MAMSLNEMKNTFLSGDHERARILLRYIQNELGVPEAGIWDYKGYKVICVPPNEYERILREGKKYAKEKDMGMYWLDYKDVRRSPIASVDIGYGSLPKGLLPGERKEDLSNRRILEIDEYTPKCVLDYFGAMKEHLKVDSIFRTYNRVDNAIIITPLSLNYEEQKARLAEFIVENGYGPFETINPLTFTGKYVKEPFQYVKK